ncbi:MAG TPA: bifunctional phosphopantothenoylcysteine decarboxylase/phosphopantothenate synthase [Candidatus Nanopelagicales bacterium]|nr:bifunctional phosphopantothenoylcysteine decarboxylase/phosphopantothenate synthase [Candidatus Nanopelagicales bacterium]
MGERLAGRFIGLGITGSIAAFKAVDLLRLLRAEGADVQVLMTPSATRFVAPLTLAALSRRHVDAEVLDLLPDGRIGHVITADAADAILVAPATAHWLGAMAHGLAADVVTATCLATSAPVVVAPAMDGDMYAHPATQANVHILRSRFGYVIVEPESGSLASGQVGPGRLADLGAIVDAVVAAIGDRPVRKPDPADRPPRLAGSAADASVRDADDLVGRHVVVTAGGTAEPIDPVRFIGNRSTGTMGVAVAEAARDRGARVTLVVGMVSVPLPEGVEVVRAESATAMRAALRRLLETADGRPGFDVLVMAAAVADFRPSAPADRKIQRTDGGLTLELVANPDLLAELGRLVRGLDDEGRPVRHPASPRPFLVGFAAETGSLARAAEKLARKRVDLIVANDVAEEGSGFGTLTNRVTLVAADGTEAALPLLPKREVAERILDRVVAALDARDAAAQTGGDEPQQETRVP